MPKLHGATKMLFARSAFADRPQRALYYAYGPSIFEFSNIFEKHRKI